ncbi:MAG: DUF362 domain-containing protein [Candidatus Hydrogenedentes bacterium]|nr:DUF362 domain-containing protein [Candidatus Hydrogenedentota bacterium]
MQHQTRRDFLGDSAKVCGAVSLGALTERGTAQAVPPAMSICRWGGVAEGADAVKTIATRLTEEAVKAVGGMASYVRQGDVVWIKPNIGWNRTPEQAANTNPDVVATLVRLCLEAGAKQVKVGDRPCHPADEAYKNSGIEAAARAAGAEVVLVDENRFRDTALGGERLKNWLLYPEIFESDVIIDVPIVKHHSLATATMCMKNLMGVAGGNRGQLHQDLPNCLADLTMFLKPKLCVLDAVRVMTAHGPVGGSLDDVKQLNVIAAGRDIVALDAFGAALLGHDPTQIETVKRGHERGLGEIDYKKIVPNEMSVT